MQKEADSLAEGVPRLPRRQVAGLISSLGFAVRRSALPIRLNYAAMLRRILRSQRSQRRKQKQEKYMQAALYRECMHLKLIGVADAATIDAAVVNGIEVEAA